MNHLTIMSFHDSAENVMNDAATVANAAILKPVVDGPINDRRPQDVRYVRLQLALDFCELCTAACPHNNTTLCSSYYLELPQTSAMVNNGHGIPRTSLLFTVSRTFVLSIRFKPIFPLKCFKMGLLTSSPWLLK